MTRALLDSSLVIALFHERRVFDLSSFSDLAISSLTYAELRLGVSMARTANIARGRASALEQAQAIFGEGLPFDDAAAQRYGMITTRASHRGGDPKAHRTDRMIAAIAAARGRVLLTLNPADLRGLDEIVTVLAPPATSTNTAPTIGEVSTPPWTAASNDAGTHDPRPGGQCASMPGTDPGEIIVGTIATSGTTVAAASSSTRSAPRPDSAKKHTDTAISAPTNDDRAGDRQPQVAVGALQRGRRVGARHARPLSEGTARGRTRRSG